MKNDNYEQLKTKLKEIFQMDQTDLDFGIYRIMNTKRNEIIHYLNEQLRPQVKEIISSLASGNTAEIEKRMKEIERQAKRFKADPEDDPEYQDLTNRKAGNLDIDALEKEIFSDLYSFFSRYYEGGDFLSLRRYKIDVYAIPYEGEEVKLHWANHDQHYIKTSEYFTNYSFRLPESERRVHFRLIKAGTEQNNNKEIKGKKRRFILSGEKPLSFDNEDLVIGIDYILDSEGRSQEEINQATVESLQNNAQLDSIDELFSIENANDREITVLEHHLKSYTARNSFDYFIHKDLGGFLRRELDFFLKNEVLVLDNIVDQLPKDFEKRLAKLKALKQIGHKIILFLAQLEDFQKKLWLKKKFVVESNWCITLDRIPEKFYAEIVANEAQRKEWIHLFAIDEIKARNDNLPETFDSVPYSEPLSEAFLKDNPYLMLDTALFDECFKQRLIAEIDSLDEQTDGLLIHSENFQALNLLQDRYREKVKCIYIDPPYNTGEDEFIYKDNYRHSSWLTMMHDRILSTKKLVVGNSSFAVSINEEELFNLKLLMNEIKGEENYVTTITVKVRHDDRILKGDKDIHETTEQLVVYRNSYDFNPSKKILDNTSLGKYVWTIEVTGKPSETKLMGNKQVEIYSPNQLRIVKTNPSKTSLKRISVRGSLRTGNSSGRFYVAHIEPLFSEYRGYLFKVPDMGNDILDHRWFFIPDQNSNRVNGDYFQGVPTNKKDTKAVPYPNHWDIETNFWDYEKEFNRAGYEGSVNFRQGKKPTAFIEKYLEVAGVKDDSQSLVLDYFAGSGSTGHAVINLNREDGGKRKYILVEMGEYFDTVTKPRIQKVVYSKDWKSGKPISREGSSHCFKTIRLESYEDTLNNLILSGDKSSDNKLLEDKGSREQYLLSYMLDVESRESLLDLNLFDKPFDYQLTINRLGEIRKTTIDLVETFDYLIGFNASRQDQVRRFNLDFARDEEGKLIIEGAMRESDTGDFSYRMLKGETHNGEQALIIWREMTGNLEEDNLALDEYFRTQVNADMRSGWHPDIIYVNGDNNLLNIRKDEEGWEVKLIEEAFHRLMFAGEGV